MTYKILLCLCAIMVNLSMQDIRHFRLTRINNMKYQCTTTRCSSPRIVTVRDIRECQIACLADLTCRTITFDQTNIICEIFSTYPTQFGNMIPQTNTHTLITNNIERPPITSKHC